ncbi:HFX_2341 family transcriptional regulator domain-containing protein [Natrinema sp. LN54]|uniref:HFX_2341 family transcriptional regulator domain-containing protein n=1 Tax=Natrinema sp. LN54 TaxID=3458705 RepID=UPI00403527F5
MEVVKRVHVVPLGYEFDRILEPIRTQRADLVYLLEDDSAGDGETDGEQDGEDGRGERNATAAADYHDELREELESIVPEVRTRACDLTDVYAVLGDVTTIADIHAEDQVYVNVSGAGTIPAIGATIACMDVSTDAHAYYVEPSEYAHDGTAEPGSFGLDEMEEVPTYPIESPTREQVAIMEFLADPAAWDGFHDDRTAPPKKKDLIEYAREQELAFMADRRSPDERSGEDKGAFRVLDTHVLEPLAEDGYVTIESVGRRRVVELTERGENAYRAFRHKLMDEAGETR